MQRKLFLSFATFVALQLASPRMVVAQELELAPVDGPSITFTTSKAVNTELDFYIQSADNKAWIDLNGNKKVDPGEYLDDTDPDSKQSVTLKNQTVTIYGEMKDFDMRSSELTAISFKNQASLASLHLPNNNLNGTLDLSGMPMLAQAYLGDNKIEELKFSGSEKLTTLNLNQNKVRSLDFSQIPNLSFLFVAHNMLEKLEVKNLSKLRNIVANNNLITEVSLIKLPLFANITLTNNKVAKMVIDEVPQLKTIKLEHNVLLNPAMLQLIEMLPDRTESGAGDFFVFDTDNPEEEENQCSKTAVQKAKAKNWNVKKRDKTDYEGIDEGNLFTPAATDGPSITFSTAWGKVEPFGFYLTSVNKNCWIDLNGNAKFDANEKIDDTDPDNLHRFTLSSEKNTIYGEITHLTMESMKLTSFSLDKQKKLQALNLTDNSIVGSLVLDDMPDLLSLSLSKNKFTELKVSNCPLLDFLAAGRNELKTIDVSTLKGLRKLFVYNNQLTKLCVEDYTVLDELDASNNAIVALSLKKLPTLTIAYVGNNKIENLVIEECPELARFDISRNAFSGGERVDKLFNLLPSRKGLEKSGQLLFIDHKALGEETNYCTEDQAQQANQKNWRLCLTNGSLYNPVPNASQEIKHSGISVVYNSEACVIAISVPAETVGSVVRIINLRGEVIAAKRLSGEYQEIRLDDATQGTYLIQINDATFKLLVK